MKTFFCALIAILWFSSVYAQAPDGLRIMQESFWRDDGQDAYFKSQMVLIDKNRNERKRVFELYTKDYGALARSFIKFLEPADIAGISFLSWENESGYDTQYLYLPALGRSRRIVSSQKSLKFVNSDFTYEDMQRRRPERDEHKLLGEEQLGQWQCYVVESASKDPGDSQYSKRVSWVDKKSKMIVRIDFYDKKAGLAKRLSVKTLKEQQGIWTAMETEVADLIDNHKTLIIVKDAKYNLGIDDEIFTQRHLEQN